MGNAQPGDEKKKRGNKNDTYVHTLYVHWGHTELGVSHPLLCPYLTLPRAETADLTSTSLDRLLRVLNLLDLSRDDHLALLS